MSRHRQGDAGALLSDQVYWMYEEDFKDVGLKDWMSAHTSFLPPLHKYEGIADLWPDRLSLRGTNKATGQVLQATILPQEIQDLRRGYDSTFPRTSDRSLGVTGLAPTRITVLQGGSTRMLYCFFGFKAKWRTDSGREWVAQLKEWQKGASSGLQAAQAAAVAAALNGVSY